MVLFRMDTALYTEVIGIYETWRDSVQTDMKCYGISQEDTHVHRKRTPTCTESEHRRKCCYNNTLLCSSLNWNTPIYILKTKVPYISIAFSLTAWSFNGIFYSWLFQVSHPFSTINNSHVASYWHLSEVSCNFYSIEIISYYYLFSTQCIQYKHTYIHW